MPAHAVEITQIPSQRDDEKKGRYETTILGYRPRYAATEFVILHASVPVLGRPQQYTAFLSEPSVQVQAHAGRLDSPRAAPQAPSALDQVSEARIRLIERVHGGQASTEDSARLDILTERMRHRAPRVTKECVDEITNSLDALEGLDADLTQIKADFDLR